MPSLKPALKPENPQLSKAVPQGASIPGDNIQSILDREEIMPNPTNTGWNLKINPSEDGSVSISIFDPAGRKVSSVEQKVSKGEAIIYQDAKKLAPGIYFIEIKGAGVQFRKKAVKN